MKKINLRTNRKFVFECGKDAEVALEHAEEIAEAYGYVTIADICEFIGATPIHAETLYGWTSETIEKAYICADRSRGVYTLYLPQCDWETGERMKETEDTEESNTGEPINITISSNEWDTRRNDIEQVLNELLRNSDKIKDRPVFISIM